MKKKYLYLFLFVVMFGLSSCSLGKNTSGSKASMGGDAMSLEALEQRVLNNTLVLSREYIGLRLETDQVLAKASGYSSYDNWNQSMTRLLDNWAELERRSLELEELAGKYADEKFTFSFINAAHAVTNQEINDVYDNAPAGKKIKTLAKFLGVDAKRAFKILEQTQNEVKADAWNEAGDTFQKLETSAVVVKDGCKIAGFVGGVVLTGGTSAIASAGVVSQTAVIVTGADLVLEVSEDAANISLGNNNDVSEIVGNIRKITEPAAAILSIADMPKNVASNLDKLNAWMFGADQLRSTIQEGKVIGIELPKYEAGEDDGEIGIAVISPEDIDSWLEENGYERYDGDVEDIMNAYDEEYWEEDEEGYEEEKEEYVDDQGYDDEADGSESDDYAGDYQDVNYDDEEELSPEEVLRRMSEGDDISGAPVISIVSPSEETFVVGQARKWEAEVSNFSTNNGRSYVCNWTFYLDGSKFREMKDTCAFTHTFIDKEGALSTELKVDFYQGNSVFDENGEYIDYVKEITNSLTISRDYTVYKPVDTYRR